MDSALQLFDYADKAICPSIPELEPIQKDYGASGDCHCTKDRAFRILKEELGDKVEQFRTGMVKEF